MKIYYFSFCSNLKRVEFIEYLLLVNLPLRISIPSNFGIHVGKNLNHRSSQKRPAQQLDNALQFRVVNPD
jgi:hypothetical protein